MIIEPLNVLTLTCFCCNIEIAKHKCNLQLDEDIFINICLCDDCVKLDETHLRWIFESADKTVKQAAKTLGVNEARVRQFIYSKRLPARKIGRDLLIKSDDLEAFALIQRKTGRPMNQK